uniref:AAA+ ATPase domain-containing protein n=1 Tax=Kalanchoe fedtschenkoi TaxID=63787 RepID=A0A7N0SY84_KALFE
MRRSSAITPKTVLTAAASLAASAMLARSIINDFMPDQVRDIFLSRLNDLTRRFSTQLTLVIEEFQGFSVNQLFEAAHVYLGTKVNASVGRIRVGKGEKDKSLTTSIDRNEDMIDVFGSFQVRWRLVCVTVESPDDNGHSRGDLNSALRSEVRSYELTFHRLHKDEVFDSYLPHILETSQLVRHQLKATTLHTVNYCRWNSETLNLDHPMSFETLALDSELKRSIVEDLDIFVSRREFYRRIGKAWKRGYLLYGPPGTGKSSLIAAMARHLNYDIYDLDLTDVDCNSDLRTLLLGMTDKSILVVEDIDCSVRLQNREAGEEANAAAAAAGHESNENGNKVTLSGLLNFIDGLWSCCGDERIIVFTTNHREKLDPALLRPGRMDMHIHMSYCRFSAFKQLALNYLEIEEHRLFPEIERLLVEVDATPAEVAGELMKSSDADSALQGLVRFLNAKKMMSQNKTAPDTQPEED